MTRQIAFFEGWSWFKFNNFWLAVGTNLKFCTNVAKDLKLKVRMFWEQNPTFLEVTREKLIGGGLFANLPPTILNRVNSRTPGCINQADKNSNIITVRLCYYNYIVAHWELWHSQNILFRYCPGMLREIQLYSTLFRHMEGHEKHIQAYWRIWRNNQTYLESRVIFPYKIVPYSEPWLILNQRCLEKSAEHARSRAILEIEGSDKKLKRAIFPYEKL